MKEFKYYLLFLIINISFSISEKQTNLKRRNRIPKLNLSKTLVKSGHSFSIKSNTEINNLSFGMTLNSLIFCKSNNNLEFICELEDSCKNGNYKIFYKNSESEEFQETNYLVNIIKVNSISFSFSLKKNKLINEKKNKNLILDNFFGRKLDFILDNSYNNLKNVNNLKNETINAEMNRKYIIYNKSITQIEKITITGPNKENITVHYNNNIINKSKDSNDSVYYYEYKINETGIINFTYKLNGDTTEIGQLTVVNDISELITFETEIPSCDVKNDDEDLSIKLNRTDILTSFHSIDLYLDLMNDSFLNFSKNNGTYTLSNENIRSLSGGSYQIIITDNENKTDKLYSIQYNYSKINSDSFHYKDSIVFKNLSCKPEIKGSQNDTLFDLLCNDIENDNSLKCSLPEGTQYGYYDIISYKTTLFTLLISNSLEDAKFELRKEENNLILSSTNNFYFNEISSLTIANEGKQEKVNITLISNESISFLYSSEFTYISQITTKDNRTKNLSIYFNTIDELTLFLPKELFFYNNHFSNDSINIQFKKNGKFIIPENAEENIYINQQKSTCEKENNTLLCKFSVPTSPKEIIVSYKDSKEINTTFYINYYTFYISPNNIINLNVKSPLNLYNIGLIAGKEFISYTKIKPKEDYKIFNFNTKIQSFSNDTNFSINYEHIIVPQLKEIKENKIQKVTSPLLINVKNQEIHLTFESELNEDDIKSISIYDSNKTENKISETSNCEKLSEKIIRCYIDIPNVEENKNYYIIFSTPYNDSYYCETKIKFKQNDIFLKNVRGEMREGKREDELILEFSTKILGSKVNVNITNGSYIITSKKCYDNDTNKSDILCIFNLQNILEGNYNLSSYSYYSTYYSSNFSIKINTNNPICIEGQIKINNECIIPEEEKNNKICENQTNICNEKGICIKNNTSFYCKCNNGWTGIYCETSVIRQIEKIEESMNENLYINEKKEYIELYNNENNTYIYLQELIFLMKQNNAKINEMIINYDSNIYNNVYKTAEYYKSISNISYYNRKNIILLLDIGIFSKSRAIQIKRDQKRKEKFKNLAEEEEIDNLTKLITYLEFYISYQYTNTTFKPTDYISYSYLSYNYYISSNFIISYNQLLSNSDSHFKLNSCFNIKTKQEDTDKVIILISFNQEISNSILNIEDELSNDIFGQMYDLKNNIIQTENKIKSCTEGGDISFKFSKEINYEKYHFYINRGIDIYNPNDSAFKPCYSNIKFDYDLPQDMRMKEIFEGKIFEIINENDCIYKGINPENQLVEFTCNNNIGNLLSEGVKIKITDYNNNYNDHLDDLPTLCPKMIKHVENNIAFWLFFWLFVIAIIMSIFTIFSNNLSKIIENDNLIKDNDRLSEMQNLKEGNDNNEENNSNNFIANYNNSFFYNFINNIKELHPLISPFRPSLISDNLICTWLLFVNIFNNLGFNALYFTNKMFRKRIQNEYRDNFFYPMGKEYHRIILAQLTSIGFTILIRAINIITLNKREEIIGQVSASENQEEVVKDYQKSFFVKKIISLIIILGLDVFFFYYTMGFCAVYRNTQYGWFYSVIWAMLFNWTLYGFFYIFVISLIESFGGVKSAYYMKRLFIF